MDLEKLVQIADSQGISVDQLIRQTRESYARFIGKKDMVRLKSLRKSTGIDPSDDLVQEVYGAYLSKGWIGLLKSLYNATGIRPSLPEEDVQQWYATYLDKRQLDKLKSLHDVTDVRPSLPEESVQQEYVDCLGEGRMDDLIILHAVTGIDPAKEVIQDIYAVLMRRRSFDNLKSLIEKTGIKVSLPDEIIQNKYFGYYNCLKSTSVIDSVDMMNQLHELTGVAPLEHTVQVAYAGFILKGDSELSCISKLHSATDINVSEETVQEGYALYAREVRLGDIKRLRSATKVKPVFRDEDVQEGYKLCLERQCMSKMESFRESTGIELSEKMVQGIYAGFTREVKLREINRLQSQTKIKPVFNVEDVQKGYLLCLEKWRMDDIGLLYGLTGIGISEKIVQEAYAGCISNDRSSRLYELQRSTGVRMSKETIQQGIAVCICGGKLEMLKYLQDLTKEAPSEEMIQRGYAAYVLNISLPGLKAMEEATGVQFSIEMFNQVFTEAQRS